MARASKSARGPAGSQGTPAALTAHHVAMLTRGGSDSLEASHLIERHSPSPGVAGPKAGARGKSSKSAPMAQSPEEVVTLAARERPGRKSKPGAKRRGTAPRQKPPY